MIGQYHWVDQIRVHLTECLLLLLACLCGVLVVSLNDLPLQSRFIERHLSENMPYHQKREKIILLREIKGKLGL